VAGQEERLASGHLGQLLEVIPDHDLAHRKLDADGVDGHASSLGILHRLVEGVRRGRVLTIGQHYHRPPPPQARELEQTGDDPVEEGR